MQHTATIATSLIFALVMLAIFWYWLRIMKVTWKYRRKSFVEGQTLTREEQRVIRQYRSKIFVLAAFFVVMTFLLYFLRSDAS